MMSAQKEPKHPFTPRLSRERIQETFVFGLLRGMTFFVLFCAAFLFWDILSKGAGKVFEGEGLINWEFLTEHPQTLHVIGEGEDEIKLSSSNYYRLKDEKMYEKWNTFQGTSDYNNKRNQLFEASKAIQNEWTDQSLVLAAARFIEREQRKVSDKFSFWTELVTNLESTASDFEIKREEVLPMVSQFMLGHFEKERGRLQLLSDQVMLFRAQQYPKIEKLTKENLKQIQLAYNQFLGQAPQNYNLAMREFGEEVTITFNDFYSKEGPKEFGRFAEALVAYSSVRQAFLEEDQNMSNWDDLQQCLSPFKEAMAVALPSRDFAYSGGGIFPAIVGTLLLVAGAMAISIVLGVFCAIFLAEYGKSGKFLSIVRLAILNLAGVPSIIFGLFGFGLFVIFLDWNVSLLAGWFTLAFMVLPIVITASEEALRSIPQGFRESSLALGATKWTMIKTSVLPFAMPGILTSSILGVARAAGETAPIMFTAAYAKRSELPWEGLEHWTDFFFQGVMALPYHIYVVSAKIPQNEYTADMQYGTAFIFLLLVVGIASLSIMLRNRLRKKYRW